MDYSFRTEEPNLKLTLEMPYSEVMKAIAGLNFQTITPNEYLVIRGVYSLTRVQHSLGLHFKDQKLSMIELFSFNFDLVSTDDEYQYIQDKLIKLYGHPKTSALQEQRYHQNQWVLNGKYELTNNQTAEHGLSIIFGMYAGFKLTSDGMWDPPT